MSGLLRTLDILLSLFVVLSFLGCYYASAQEARAEATVASNSAITESNEPIDDTDSGVERKSGRFTDASNKGKELCKDRVDKCDCSPDKISVACKCDVVPGGRTPSLTQTALNLNGVKIGSETRNLDISGCDFTELDDSNIFGRGLQVLSVRSALSLDLESKRTGSKRIDRMTIQNVSKVAIDDSFFDNLVILQSINIINSNFTSSHPLKFVYNSSPTNVKFEKVVLPDGKIKISAEDSDQHAHQPSSEPSLSLTFDDCDLTNHFKLDVSIEKFRMKNSRFNDIPSKESFNIRYKHSADFTNNSLMGVPLPDVNYYTSGDSVKIKVKLDRLTETKVAAKRWLECFKVAELGRNPSTRIITQCAEKKINRNEMEVSCKGPEEFNRFVDDRFQRLDKFSGVNPISGSPTLTIFLVIMSLIACVARY